MSQTSQVGSHKTTINTKDGITSVRYYSTDVVKFGSKGIILNSGGYRTHTTKTRMNQASNQFDLGFHVYQRNWDWYVEYKGKTIDFTDEMVLDR